MGVRDGDIVKPQKQRNSCSGNEQGIILYYSICYCGFCFFWVEGIKCELYLSGARLSQISRCKLIFYQLKWN